jgi:hypothetical protein
MWGSPRCGLVYCGRRILRMITGVHAIYLMCDDIQTTIAELEAKGVEFTGPVSDERFGLLTSMRVPGGGELGLYEPRHPTPLAPP